MPEPTQEEEEQQPSTPSRKEKAKTIKEKAKTFIEAEIASGDLERFVKYCADFGKSYVNQQEFKFRLYNWKQTEKFIESMAWHTRRSYQVAHNVFSDWSQQEYEKMLGYAAPVEKKAKSVAK